jgi:AraC-like DNA-binding protein
VDLALEMLGSLRLTGGLFLEADFSAPWCVTARVEPEDCLPYLRAPRTIIAYHLVTAGRLVLEVDGGQPVPVTAGEIVVMPRNDPHRLASAPGLRPIRADELIQPAPEGGLARIVHGGGGEETRLFCGYLGSDAARDPMLRMLPAVLKIDADTGVSGAWIESSIRLAALELKAGRSGSPAMLQRLAELLLAQAVRRYLAALPPGQTGWLAGLRDPMVGRALALIHERTAERWTTERLAREAGMSRSAFATHFTRLMGEPPMRYLASCRLRLACRLLRDGRDPVARIAVEAGYESEAAFNRAFKRALGAPPGIWRRRGREESAEGG